MIIISSIKTLLHPSQRLITNLVQQLTWLTKVWLVAAVSDATVHSAVRQPQKDRKADDVAGVGEVVAAAEDPVEAWQLHLHQDNDKHNTVKDIFFRKNNPSKCVI